MAEIDKKQEIRHDHLNSFGKARVGLEDEIDKCNAAELEKGKAEKDDLLKYKQKFLQIDKDGSGDLDTLEILSFLNGSGVKDGAKAWTEPKIKEKIITKFDETGKGKLRYAGFLRFILGDDLGKVLRLKMKFEKMASESSSPTSSKKFEKSW